MCSVKAFPLRNPRKLLTPRPGWGIRDYRRHFKWADACILTVGTPIYDYDHVSRIIHCGLPRLIGKELIGFGVRAKPVRSFHGKLRIRWFLKNVAAISTRDRGSEQELRKMGLGGGIPVTGDSALFLEPEAIDEETLKKFEMESFDRPVVICPRAISPNHRTHYHAPITHATVSKLRWNIASVADHVAEAGHEVVFVPMHRAPGDDDTVEIAEIRGRMKKASTVVGNVESPEAVAKLLGWMNVVFGMRLYSLILAAIGGVPIVGIDYYPKIRGFMKYAGATDYLCETEDHVHTVTTRIEKALDDSTDLKKTLLSSCGEMRAKIIEESHRIAEIINRER